MSGFHLALIWASVLALVSCGKSDPNPDPDPDPVDPKIELSAQNLDFTAEGGEQTVGLMTTADWSAQAPSWVTMSQKSGEKAEYLPIKISVGKNESVERSGNIRFSITGATPLNLTVRQQGMKKIEISVKELSFLYDGETKGLSIKSPVAWSTQSSSWLTLSQTSGEKTDGLRISVTAPRNEGEERTGVIEFLVAGEIAASVSVKQDGKSSQQTGSLEGKKFVIMANSMVYYGGLVQKGNQGAADPGMFSKLLQAHGIKATVIDCTYGNHSLHDFIAGCQISDCKGEDHLKNLDFGSFDYVIISEAGNNNSQFYEDAAAVYGRFTAKNPNAKLVYINHIYSVFKSHTKVLGKLKALHDNLGVTIVNVGQLGYDIYTGAVKIPGSILKYSDKYTFVNHTSSDSHHPNPLMGYMMTQMLYCALTGEQALGTDYRTLLDNCKYAAGSTTYDSYYKTYYTTAAALPFTDVVNSETDMKGIQKLIPSYVNKW